LKISISWVSSPIFHSIMSSNQLSRSSLHTNFKSLHHKDSCDLTPYSLIPCQFLYFELSTLSHNSLPWWNIFHLHLASSALSNQEISFIPNPPCSFGEQIFSQLTQDIFSLPSSQPHKNLLCNLANVLATLSRILKND